MIDLIVRIHYCHSKSISLTKLVTIIKGGRESKVKLNYFNRLSIFPCAYHFYKKFVYASRKTIFRFKLLIESRISYKIFKSKVILHCYASFNFFRTFIYLKSLKTN